MKSYKSLYRTKKITKKVYNNIMNSKRYNTKMNTIFMDSKHSKTSYPRRRIRSLKIK